MVTELDKIEKSLTIRFEKDKTFYVSKEDKEKIKKSLYKNNNDIFKIYKKKYDFKILAKLILDNCYLIIINKKNKKEYKKILNSLEKEKFEELVKPIIENKRFSTSEFKSLVEEILLEFKSLKECEEIYFNVNFKITDRIICFRKILHNYIKKDRIEEFLEELELRMNENIEVKKYIEINLNEMFETMIYDLNENSKERVSKWILKNKILKEEFNLVFEFIFIEMSEQSFKSLILFLNDFKIIDYRKKEKIIIITLKKIIIKMAKENYNIEKIEKIILKELYKNNIKLRKSLLIMLDRLENRYVDIIFRKALLDEFKKVGIDESNKDIQESIEDSFLNPNSKLTRTTLEVISEILSEKTNIKNIKTLDYFKMIFTKNLFIVEDIYNEYLQNEKIKSVFLYYVSTLYKREKLPYWIYDIKLDKSMKIEIAKNIENYDIKTEIAKDFLSRNKFYTILENLNKR